MGSDKVEEALKYKVKAESMIISEDYTEAREMINKAQQIFPALIDVSEMQAVCNILCAANMELPGCGIDWYWVLQLQPSANDDEIKSQYSKLTALLEPVDKKFPGTESALKFIRDAQSVLLDGVKRSVFDLKRNASRRGCRYLNSETPNVSELTNADVEATAAGSISNAQSSLSKRSVDETYDESNGISVLEKPRSKRLRDVDIVDLVTERSVVNALNYVGVKEHVIHKPMEKTNAQEARISAQMKSQRSGGEERLQDNVGLQMGSNVNSSDPQTQVYKRKWSVNDFAEDQIWAVYDGPDAMPRLYVKVNNVISPNKVCVTYLEPHPMHDDEILWVEENLPFVCGIFRASRTTVNLEMSKFSFLVKCERSMKKSFYKIYPREGEIWALYKKWHNQWKVSDYNNYQCHVVEILSDFSEESGMSIARLVPVNGCMTFYQREVYEGFKLVQLLSRMDLLSFSHRIPAFDVPGIENHGIPKGSWHLEPNALPPKSRT
ncbi:uncharacterized protein LOC143889921 [Tasmannia lanceolata]|uniref:uncharacterized protein LOC143889921 n=1 Tax=Tasmannia lanceolata TaxID=3420 RepID=UPI0040649FCE